MNPIRKATLLLPLFAALLLSLSARAQEEAPKAKAAERLSKECVGDPAYKTLEACPGGPQQFDIKKKRSAAFQSAPPPRDVNKETDVKPPPPTAGLEDVRDQRKSRLQARARKLLITEITGLERLYQNTRKKSPDRPQLVRRLAEGYVELESAANRDKIQAEIKADEAKTKKNRAQYEKSRSEAGKAKDILKQARKNAIKYYKTMKKDYPDYSKIDEVLYYLAYEYEQDGDMDNARKAYQELVTKAPKSKYVPNAYLAFGELFFVEAMGDPGKWALAENFYKEVLKYPPPENKVYGYARYKLAYVYWNNGDHVKAIQEFKEVIDYGNQYASLPGAEQLQKSARRDIVPVYAVKGRPDKAYPFFKGISGDKSGDDKTLDMLRSLGIAYIDTGHYKEAIVLYHDLMSRDKGDHFCDYQVQITKATQAIAAGDKPAIVKELDQQVQIRNDFIKSSNPEAAKLKCSNGTAELLAETAMSWHLEAVGSGGVRGTGSKDTMDKAAYVYKRVVENFTQKDFAKFAFPRIVKTDWPTIYKIKYAMADLLYFQERWEDCGPAFDSVVEEDPTSAEAPEAAYAAVLCYQKMYDLQHKGDEDRKGKGLGPKGTKEDRESKKGEWEKFKPKDFDPKQKGMIQAFNRYVCYIKPPKGDAEAEEQYVEVKYARARTYFEAQHWEEAAIGFRDVAINHSDKDASIYAAQLYLEAINVLGSRTEPPRPTCFSDMAADVPVFIQLFCEGKKAEENKEQCLLLSRIQCDVQRLKAEKIVELADSMGEKGQEGALDKYKEGGDAYIDLWRTYGEEQLQAGEESQCGKMEEILHNAAQAYQAARLLAKAITVRRLLLDPKYKLDETDLAKKAIYQIGGNYQAIAVYDVSATYYEKYAEKTKYKGEFADKALSDAAVLRLGLGQEDQAIDDAKNFNQYFGRKAPDKAAQIAFAVAAHFAHKKDWQSAKTRLMQGMPLIDKNASLDIRAQAHALLGKAYMELNMPTPAAGEYNKVAGMWRDPAKAAGEIEGMKDEDAASKQRRLGRALEAVGEALFYFAEQAKEKKVDKLGFPAYTGQKDKEGITKHINTKVKDWYTKKSAAIKEVAVEYKKIVDLQPVPPPRWAIAAGSRVGEMWGKFVADFRSAPIPKAWESDYEIRTAYYGALDDASEPYKQGAKGAYNLCLDYSVKYQYFDEYSRACEEWLAENYKAEYHLIDEFRGSPNRVNSVLKERPNPLKMAGDPYVVLTEEQKKVDKAKDTDKAKEGKK